MVTLHGRSSSTSCDGAIARQPVTPILVTDPQHPADQQRPKPGAVDKQIPTHERIAVF